MERAGRPCSQLAHSLGFAADALFSPLAGTDAESPLEAGVEKAQMIEAALFGDVDDFSASVTQQRNGLQETHFHSERGDGITKKLMKQTIQVTPAAAEFHRQFPNRKAQELVHRQMLKNLDHALFNTRGAGSLGLGRLEFFSQNGSR